MLLKRTSLPPQLSEKSRTYAASYLVWAMIGVILLLWCVNIFELVTDYQNRIEQKVSDHQQRLLDDKQDALEQTFRKIYEHSRTISLLPSVRGVEGGNRKSEEERVRIFVGPLLRAGLVISEIKFKL